jgi:hypothetical protein
VAVLLEELCYQGSGKRLDKADYLRQLKGGVFTACSNCADGKCTYMCAGPVAEGRLCHFER